MPLPGMGVPDAGCPQVKKTEKSVTIINKKKIIVIQEYVTSTEKKNYSHGMGKVVIISHVKPN